MMSDLISRRALLKKIAHHTMFDCLRRVTFESANTYEQVKGAMFELAQKAPAVDAVPVVHARWIREKHGIVRCSCCNKEYIITNGVANALQFFYCPNCGAKMDGGADNG